MHASQLCAELRHQTSNKAKLQENCSTGRKALLSDKCLHACFVWRMDMQDNSFPTKHIFRVESNSRQSTYTDSRQLFLKQKLFFTQTHSFYFGPSTSGTSSFALNMKETLRSIALMAKTNSSCGARQLDAERQMNGIKSALGLLIQHKAPCPAGPLFAQIAGGAAIKVQLDKPRSSAGRRRPAATRRPLATCAASKAFCGPT